MDLHAQGLSHLSSADIGYGMQGQAVEELIVVEEVFPYAVDDQVQQLVLFVEEQGHGKVSDLLLGILVRGYEIDGFEVSEIDVPSEDVYVQELCSQVSDSGETRSRLPPRVRTLQTYFFLWYPLRFPSGCSKLVP